MTLVERLAAWALELQPEAIPADALERAKLLLLDAMGCALAALREESCQDMLRVVGRLGGSDECTIIGSASRGSAANAVLANAALTRFLDLNDQSWGQKPGGHPSDNMAIGVAVGEREHSRGLDVLAAIVVAYEIEGRLRILNGLANGWDYSTVSSLMGPALAGRLMKLDHERLSNAFGLAATFGPALGIARYGQLSAAKWLASGMVSHTAVIATELAAAGISGPRAVLEGPRGWAQTVSQGADLEGLVAPWDGSFRILDASIKAFPCLGTAQAAVAAALQARASFGDRIADVERVEVRMADVAMVRHQLEDVQRMSPASRETADHSFPFLVGVALLDGELTLRQFEDERWLAPDARDMMGRIKVETDTALNRYIPGTFPAWIKVTLRSGETFEAEVPYAPGHHMGGLTTDHVTSKFDRYASPHLDDSRRSEIKDLVLSLENVADVSGIMRLLAA
jgi:2-methylcitrate dehydratase